MINPYFPQVPSQYTSSDVLADKDGADWFYTNSLPTIREDDGLFHSSFTFSSQAILSKPSLSRLPTNLLSAISSRLFIHTCKGLGNKWPRNEYYRSSCCSRNYWLADLKIIWKELKLEIVGNLGTFYLFYFLLNFPPMGLEPTNLETLLKSLQARGS